MDIGCKSQREQNILTKQRKWHVFWASLCAFQWWQVLSVIPSDNFSSLMGLEGHDKRQKNNNLRKYGVPSWKPIQLTMFVWSFSISIPTSFCDLFPFTHFVYLFPFAGRFPFALSAPPSEAWRQVHRPPSHTKHCCGESTMVSRVVMVLIMVLMVAMIVHLHMPNIVD